MHAILIFLLYLVCFVTSRQSDYCLENDDDPYLYFATKSPYNFMHGQLKPERRCNAIQIFMISRHGTRYPKLRVIQKMKELPKLRDQIIENHLGSKKMGHLCDMDLQNLRTWKLNNHVENDFAGFLTSQGERDLKELATRLRVAFPDLLQSHDSRNINAEFVFRSSRTQRTEASMAAFIEGLFNGKSEIMPLPAPMNDTLLHAYENCPAWSEETEKENYAIERHKFENGTEMQILLLNVSRRLGFAENLTLETVDSIYDMCRFEKAWEISKVSPWCAAFNKKELEILEYREDLKYYYYTGPGRTINNKLGCPPLKDMFEHFRKLEGDDYSREPRGIFYFSHTVTLQTLVTALGIRNDFQPLLASNFRDMVGRQWRTSFLGPFATNFVAVFYKCNETSPYYGGRSRNKVLLHLSEKLVELDGCNVGLCDWEFIKNEWEKKAEQCNMNFCFNASGLLKCPDSSIVFSLIPILFLVSSDKL